VVGVRVGSVCGVGVNGASHLSARRHPRGRAVCAVAAPPSPVPSESGAVSVKSVGGACVRG
jgi:hypothetical protein